MTDEPAPPVPLSLAALLEALAARLDRVHEGTDGLLLRAVPVKAAGAGKVYGGFVSARLRDARPGDSIDARVPEQRGEESADPTAAGRRFLPERLC